MIQFLNATKMLIFANANKHTVSQEPKMTKRQNSLGKFNPSLTHFNPMFCFYTLWKRLKTSDVLKFSGGFNMEH